MKDQEKEVKLFPCEPVDWLWLPHSARRAIGWFTLLMFSFSFFVPILMILLLIPYTWQTAPISATIFTVAITFSFLLPPKEWPEFRKMGQLWYEIFQFSSNLSQQDIDRLMKYGEENKLIFAMHPHGILPLHAVLGTTYCDQYFRNGKDTMYGFAAVADMIFYTPFLRNINHFLTAGPAHYSTLKDGLIEGKSLPANANGRKPRHLYIFPGGIAEIYCSKPGHNAIIFKSRKGLIRLSVETGAHLVPVYVFGGTDFFYNLITSDNYISRLSRRFRLGFTIFWGQFGLPIPLTPRVTMAIGNPIPIPEITDKMNKEEIIDQLHQQFMNEMIALFDQYKAAAGYPDASLEIL